MTQIKSRNTTLLETHRMKPSPRPIAWSLLPVLTAALLTTATNTSSAATMISNLGNANGGGLGVVYRSFPYSWLYRANTFTTGASPMQLNSVTLDMSTGPQLGGGFSVSIYSYSGSGPSSLLASLAGTDNPGTAGTYTYTDGSSLALAANTDYFVVAAVPGAALDKYYPWNYTSNGAETGAAGWSIGDNSWYSEDGGSSWVNYGFTSAAKFSVDASEITAVPEPGVMLPLPVLLASGLMLRRRRKSER